MKKVTNRERLEEIRDSLEKGINFIQSDSVEIIKDYGSMGKVSINKDVGSDICYLYNALEQVVSLIDKKVIKRC